jgi:hypothetical protein
LSGDLRMDGSFVTGLEARSRISKELRHCRFGDIALLALAATELWRIEEVLEDLAFPAATQAEKGFFRRHKIHDQITTRISRLAVEFGSAKSRRLATL